MLIGKAIEILATHPDPMLTASDHDFFEAKKLGIEALKAVKECRASHIFCPGLTMPGETLPDSP